jgi:hypothetical protein
MRTYGLQASGYFETSLVAMGSGHQNESNKLRSLKVVMREVVAIKGKMDSVRASNSG